MPITMEIPLHQVRWINNQRIVKQSATTIGGAHGSVQPKQKYISIFQKKIIKHI